MNIYRFKFSSTCPVDGCLIQYEAEIISDTVIFAEEIIKAIPKSGIQEGIADDFFQKFNGRQTIRGTHQGVEIVTVRG